MSIEENIQMMWQKDQKAAYKALQELLDISEHSDEVYSHFEVFIDMMRDEKNSFVRTRGLRLIAYNAKWDSTHKLDLIIDEYLKHIEDDKPITSRQCIKDCVRIAQYRPELIDKILKALASCSRIYDDSMQSLVYKDRKKAIRQIRQLTW